MSAPDLTFALTDNPDIAGLRPIYIAVLSAGPKPRICLTDATREQAEDWLRTQHDRYREGIGKRSHLIQAMDLPARVTLVDAQGFPI